MGRRSAASRVAVNCAALPKELAEAELFGSDLTDRATGKLGQAGRIRSAHRGTLFLDEIDTMHGAVQAKLLRVIEEREVQPLGASAPEPVDLRVVAATKTDLMDRSEEHTSELQSLMRISYAVFCFKKKSSSSLFFFSFFS